MFCLREGLRLAAMAACLAGAAIGNALVYSDNFDDGTIDPGLWSPQQAGGPSIGETNELLANFPGTSWGSDFYAGVEAAFALVGDFDVSVDFRLHVWPASNGMKVGLVVPNYISIERTDFGGFETYLTNTEGGLSLLATDDRAGSLRLTRKGDTVAGYAWIGGDWQMIGSHSGVPGTPAQCLLRVWSHDYAFGQKDASVAFDNFLAVDSAVPEPATWLTLGGLALLSRRRRR